VADGGPESFDGLPGKCAPGSVGDRSRYHEGHVGPPLLQLFRYRVEGGLRVQRIEDGLDHQDVGAAVEKPPYSRPVALPEVLEGDGAKAGVGHIGRNARGFGRRTEHADREPGPPGRRVFGAGRFREHGARTVELVREVFHLVVRKRDGSGIERIGFDKIGACFEVLCVDAGDYVGPGERQQIVVSANLHRMGGKPLPAKIRFTETQGLDHGAHRAVKYEKPVFKNAVECLSGIHAERIAEILPERL